LPSLPTGTVTFLFTDIEGSTRLLQQLGDRYAEVLATHHRLLSAAIQEAQGQVVDTQGDAVFAVFPRARDALLAAIAAQRAVQAYPWPDGIVPKVRAGLHTGEPVTGETGYVGMDVHRAARIAAAGHGGQTLLSDTTHALVAKDLPEGIALRDLGEHRLKDLAHPHRLFQIVHPGLSDEFPPLRSLDAHPHNLPIQLTSFIGRAREIAEVKRLVGAARLVTLTGSGGAGKTRLALQVAADVVECYRDGVWLAEFAPIADAALVPKSVASALSVPEQPGREVTETLVDVLRPRALLLVLDNCEHLLAACADLTAALLRACPQVHILATSREGLGVPGETLWRVPSLSLPDVHRLPPSEDLVLYEAVRLFVDRAVATTPGFALTSENAAAVVQVCQRLDGIPLAIELAAARVKVLAVEQIGMRLDDRFRLLTGGSRMVLPRHQTLQATMDWSYDLLSETERALLRRLSVFAGGWTLEATESACAGGAVEAAAILDLLTSLVDKSLVLAETRRGEARYRLSETVRQYGRDRLVESGETDVVRTRHRDWCVDLAERAESRFRGPEQIAWLERLETEHDNLRTALEWSKTQQGGAESWLRLAAALHWFWFMRGDFSEGREWLEGALSIETSASPSLRARALCGAGLLALRQSDSNAGKLLQESLALFRELGDKWGVPYSLHHLAHVAERQGDYERSAALFEESLALFRDVGNRWGIGWSLHCMGDVTLSRGDYGRAKALLEESLPLCREVGNTFTLAYLLHNLGRVAEKQGDYERATALFEEGLVTARQVGNKYHIPNLQCSLASVSLRRGDYERAVTLYRQSLAPQKEIGDKLGLVQCLEGLAGVACAQRDYEKGVRLFGAAEGLRETLAVHRAPSDQADHDQRVTSARAALGDAVFAAALAEGRAMTLEQAIEYALAAEPHPEEGHGSPSNVAPE
jgi:predicted ATPase/class 3 adenylate cyclase/Tfp pilus assembly protein PilF